VQTHHFMVTFAASYALMRAIYWIWVMVFQGCFLMKRLYRGALMASILGFMAVLGATQAPLAHGMINRPASKDTSSASNPWPTAHKGQAMVAAGTKEAVKAGIDIINQGGSAIDAAVAVQATLSLTEPQSSGIGGGAFMLYYDAKTKKTTVYYGRETAPMSAQPDRFLRADKSVMSYGEAVTGGRATGFLGLCTCLRQDIRITEN